MKLKYLLFLVPLSLQLSASSAAPGGEDGALKAVPAVFDFGWAPEDVKIFADFVIKNDSAGIVDVSRVRPTCGCTAANFVPSKLSPGDTLPFSLAFNTRGYTKKTFLKSTVVHNESGLPTLGIDLRGHVLNPSAGFAPAGTGLVEFSEKDKDKRKVVELNNKTAESLTLSVVQKPEEWAGWSLSREVIPSSGTVRLEFFVSPPFDQKRETSLTFEAKGKTKTHRATVAIQTGDHSRRQMLRPAQ